MAKAEPTPAGYQAKGAKKKEGKKELKRIEIECLDSGYKVEKQFVYKGQDKYDYPSPPREEYAVATEEDVLKLVAECLGVELDGDESDESSESKGEY